MQTSEEELSVFLAYESRCPGWPTPCAELIEGCILEFSTVTSGRPQLADCFRMIGFSISLISLSLPSRHLDEDERDGNHFLEAYRRQGEWLLGRFWIVRTDRTKLSTLLQDAAHWVSASKIHPIVPIMTHYQITMYTKPLNIQLWLVEGLSNPEHSTPSS